ncbi:hypothetical protein LOTGIDRAFT_195736 [Lottia gigantea]|uniref:VPS35 endosomal protein-sorting factor-like n=1 Tax=Lottia gigantea TaxID=225164 RepID=V4B9V8_LOTGI|nr:hypothetical protein LOTGIDRAFT_195736 [Lottia gigantea]ESO85799.1 hypothetical protein LOTGIDRAFT_195736 [Lottia gigantea]
MATYEWYFKKRDYDSEAKSESFTPQPTDSHPLKSITVTEVKKSVHVKKNSQPLANQIADPLGSIDPLGASNPLSQAFEGVDPLSKFAAEVDIPVTKKKSNSFGKTAASDIVEDDLDENFEPWSTKKANILARYTTSEKLSITTSFLSASDKEKVVIKAQTTSVSDKVKNRLEQLDDFDEGSVQQMLNLSQQDYVKRIDELNLALVTAWEKDHRVTALKIAIQCSKLLADTSVIPFYPSKFVLITDILDTFGKLVYDRLREKAQYIPAEKFTSDQVPESAKETCRNWFFKIASIRELIPRFYVEAALIKSYNFLKSNDYSEALSRLAYMCRGIGDPLVAAYARCYLCRVGFKVAPSITIHLMPCLDDFLKTFPQIQGDSVQNILAMQKLEMPRYLTLFSPAVDWLLQCCAHRASDKVLTQILEKCKEQCNSALLVNSIMSAFNPQFIAARSNLFTDMIKECEDTGLPKHLLYRTHGLCLVMADPPADQKLTVLNDVWKVVTKLKNPSEYIGCAETWIEFVAKNFGKREINTIIGDIIKHMTPDRAYEDYYPQLLSVVSKILVHQHDFSLLFSLEKFMPFIDMFQRETVKVEACKTVAESFDKYQVESTNDPVVINAMMFICKTMHDSVNALTLEDEKRVISNMICGFIRQILFGRDFEQQLSFYVEARSNFSNLDTVLIQLIQSVNKLSMDTRQVVKGNHSRKTAAFVRACAAYCFITIPSLQSVYSQLQLYLISGQVALLNQCYSQGDAFFKAAISLIPDLPKQMEIDGKTRATEPILIDYILNFISTILTIPDNPEAGVMYMLKGLLNVLQDYTWDNSSDAKAVVYIRVLALLSAASQESYIYHIDKVDSNDKMYGSDPKYINELKGMADTLINEILSHLKTLATPELGKRQSSIALELVNTIIAHGDITNKSMNTLFVNLWSLTQKYSSASSKQLTRLLNYIKKKGEKEDNRDYKDLGNKLKVES